jgi:hypothetical protein
LSQLFLSYSHADAPWVKHLRTALIRRGFDVWIDRENIEASKLWLPSIEQAIVQCEIVVLVLSPHSEQSSSFVGRELSFARQHGKTILPIRRQAFNQTGSLKEFALVQYVDFGSENFSTAIDKLALDLNRKWIFACNPVPSISISSIVPGHWNIDMQDQGPLQMELILRAECNFDGTISRRASSSVFGVPLPVETRDYFSYSGTWRADDTEVVLDGRHSGSNPYPVMFWFDEISNHYLKGVVAHNELPCRWRRI